MVTKDREKIVQVEMVTSFLNTFKHHLHESPGFKNVLISIHFTKIIRILNRLHEEILCRFGCSVYLITIKSRNIFELLP